MTQQSPTRQVSASGAGGIFQRQESVDKPGIIGARWWQESIATQVPRRQAMTGLLVLGGVLAAMTTVGACVAIAASGSTPDTSVQQKTALEMQKEYGWNFGATGEALVFDGQSTATFERSALKTMADDLAPSDSRYTPYFIPTLFQSPTALRKTVPSGETDAPAFQPLGDVLVPISTALMDVAYRQGQAFAALFEKDPRGKDVAVMVDLPGPEAVAFAAGAANVFDPVFLFDNWPHPRGVVPAHLTLAAAAYYQPLFVKAKASRPSNARPMFVLDRKRLATYTDDATQFDNRHVAKVPNSAGLIGIGTRHLVLVSPNAVEKQELDDLADDFLAYSISKMPVHVVPATAFEAGSNVPLPIINRLKDAGTDVSWMGPYFYGGSVTTHQTFWTHWNTPAAANASTLSSSNEVQPYTPVGRKTAYSAGATTTPASRPRPTNFGMVPVVIAVGTGVILGAKLSRSGSWNRSSSSSSSGGS